jgi:predicted SAM-dependent methyltransferase
MIVFFKKAFIKLFKKRISRSSLYKSKKAASPIRLMIGSGYTLYKNWIITDIDTLNIAKEDQWEKYFKRNSISSILAEHVWEHLNGDTCKESLKNCYQFLAAKGNLRLAVPDGYNPDMNYIKSVKPGGSGIGAYDHKFLYNYKTLTKILREVGFTVKLLEYYDETGKFHFNEWSAEKGYIQRSALNDKRNKGGRLKYTSLIIDAVK